MIDEEEKCDGEACAAPAEAEVVAPPVAEEAAPAVEAEAPAAE